MKCLSQEYLKSHSQVWNILKQELLMQFQVSILLWSTVVQSHNLKLNVNRLSVYIFIVKVDKFKIYFPEIDYNKNNPSIV